MRYDDRNVVVLGAGLTGASLARYLVREGAHVRVADTRADPAVRGELARTCRRAGRDRDRSPTRRSRART